MFESFGGCTPPIEKNAPYPTFLSHVKIKKDELRRLWQESRNRDSVLLASGKYLQQLIYTDLFNYWKGTPWNFYGTSTIPGKGAIACGYFVTTLLQDAGVKLGRVKLAETYSEDMIKSLVTKEHISKYVPLNLEKFIRNITKVESAVYIVGLDNHTGFIVVENHEAWFIHSSFVGCSCVAKEKATESGILQRNRYLVAGCLTGDTVFLKKWMGVY